MLIEQINDDDDAVGTVYSQHVRQGVCSSSRRG